MVNVKKLRSRYTRVLLQFGGGRLTRLKLVQNVLFQTQQSCNRMGDEWRTIVHQFSDIDQFQRAMHKKAPLTFDMMPVVRKTVNLHVVETFSNKIDEGNVDVNSQCLGIRTFVGT